MENLRIDAATELMIRILQGVELEKHDYFAPSWIKNNDGVAERVRMLLIYLGLAQSDVNSPLGWTPTSRLMTLVANRVLQVGHCGFSRSYKAYSVPKLLSNAVWSARPDTISHMAEWKRTRHIGQRCGFKVLTFLRVLREDKYGGLWATQTLYELLDESGHSNLLRQPSACIPLVGSFEQRGFDVE